MRFSPRSLKDGFDRARTRRQAAAREQHSATERELAARLRAQWEEGRAARREQLSIDAFVDDRPEVDQRVVRVPYGVELAAAWSWRILVICGALAILLFLVDTFMIVVLPLVIALFIAALCAPLVSAISRVMPRKLAALLVVVGGIGLVSLLFTVVGTQISSGFTDLSNSVVDGLGKIRHWLQHGPFKISDTQIDDAIKQAQDVISSRSKDLVGQATELGTAVGHVVAGMFIVLFATYFFLADGELIWTWIVRLFPRVGRRKADSSGRVAWRSMIQFVRATVLVAATDAIGIAIIAAILGLPLVGAIGILVFLGAFVPMIGAFVSGTVAVLVALVAKGPVVALIMFGGVVLVQQIEAHVLQPFLMGRFVSVHPLGVIVAIALGVLVAGIPGALIAVPLAASLNAVGQHLADYTEVGESAVEAAEDDPEGPEPGADDVPEDDDE